MPLDCSQPFVFDVRNQRFSFCGIGLCDPQLVGTVNGVIPFVYQHVFFSWTIADGNLVGPATNTTVEALTSAIGDTAPGAWFTQTPRYTNLPEKKGGSPVPRNFIEIVRGVMADVPPLFAQLADSSTSASFMPQAFSNAPNGAFYVGMVQEWTINYTDLQLKQSDTGCQYRLGLLKHAPGWVGVVGPQTTRNGNVSVIGFVPFTVAVCFGSEDDIRQISIPVTTGQQHVIEGNDAQPLPTDLINDTVYQPVEITLIGNICYVPDVYACTPPGVADRPVLSSNGLGMPVLPG